jgi:hypothetical protein
MTYANIHPQSLIQQNRQECIMSDRDAWEKAESLSKIFAAVFIPVVLGLASLLANQALEKSKTRDELLKQAIDVVFLSKSDQMAGSDKSFESRRAHRSHWLEIYNSLADVKLSQEFIAIMMELDTRVDGTELYTIENRPNLIPNSERADSTNEDELGHGWVAVGRLNSERYSDANFTVAPKATNRDGTIKPHEIIRARWSVSLRLNSRNLEDRQGYTGTSRGLLWGGECGKVIDSRVDGRLQTWAFIEIVQCPQTTKSDPGFERRAMSGVRSLF